MLRRLVMIMVGLMCLGSLAGCLSDGTREHVQLFNDDGVRQFSMGRYNEARESFEAASSLAPDDAALLYNLGQCHDRLGDPSRADRYFTACLQKKPGHGDARLALMATYYRTGRREQANRMIEEWLAREPGVADVYMLDAWRLRQENALPQAQARLQQALSLEPNNPRALTELGILYEAMGRPERSRALYERVLQTNPNQLDIADRIAHLRNRGVRQPLPD